MNETVSTKHAYKSPLMFKKTKTGNFQQWQIIVTESFQNGFVSICMLSGKVDGKITLRTKEVLSGKNLGRSNETTTVEQAILDAQSTFNKKIDEGYRKSIAECKIDGTRRPMLAHTYEKHKKKLNFPCFAQRKLNGVRCTIRRASDGTPIFESRKGKDYTQFLIGTRLYAQAKIMFEFASEDEVFDGEIYKHEWPFQRIISAIKKRSDDTEELEFWFYDIMNNDDNSKRIKRISSLAKKVQGKYCRIIPVETIEIQLESLIQPLHDGFVENGYEGMILRNANGKYLEGARSHDLLKYKAFIDEEFEIVGSEAESQTFENISTGEVKHFECIVFWCVTKKGAPFTCRPKGTLKSRAEMWKHRDDYVGKELTVRYFELTDKHYGKGKEVPLFPVGLAVRDWE